MIVKLIRTKQSFKGSTPLPAWRVEGAEMYVCQQLDSVLGIQNESFENGDKIELEIAGVYRTSERKKIA